MKETMPYVDICFGNEIEAETLFQVMDYNTKDLTEIAVKLAQSDKVTSRPRTVVITNGALPTIVVKADKSRVWSINTFDITPIKKECIVDTNGAGDAFVGGFLAGLAKGKTIEDCVKTGSYSRQVSSFKKVVVHSLENQLSQVENRLLYIHHLSTHYVSPNHPPPPGFVYIGPGRYFLLYRPII